jgi:integrase
LEVQSIGTFFRHAARLGLVEDNPVSRIRPIRLSQRTPVYLDADEVRRFLQAAATYDDWARSRYPIGSFLRDILVTYLKTGMRLEELRYLEWSDVDMKQGEVIVRGEKEVEDRQEIPISPETLRALRQLGEEKFDALDVEGKQQILGRRLAPKRELVNLRYKDFGLKEGILARGSRVKWNPKTKGRVVPISPGLLPILESLPRNGNLVYPDPQTGGLWRLKINRLVKRCAEHAGITKNVHTHVLRHTFATQLRQRGVPLETIKELLGHADIRETLIYAHFSPEEARAAIPKIDFF